MIQKYRAYMGHVTPDNKHGDLYKCEDIAPILKGSSHTSNNTTHTIIELLRYVFYYRLPHGDKVADLIHEKNIEKWRSIYSALHEQ